MSKRFFWVAFVTGLLVLAWVAWGFVGTHALALVITLLIAGVYLLGAHELRQFRAATAGLAQAVAGVPQPLATLAEWLERVPAALRPAVRSRVEGQARVLPGPALTPYLVGLLVMLGMLGTFLGMVVTFKGAVFALEGSADLQAMRAALADPIKGLGLSFGTSVAGVAASAMLGLMSAIARRERMDAARLLDACIATALRPFSPAHQREASLQALQAQSSVLPQLAQQLEGMMSRLEARSQQLDEQLLARHERLQRDTTQAYGELAASVGSSLKDSLAAGARAAGESITPVVTAAMAQVVQESQRLHARLGEAAQAQVAGLSAQFDASAQRVAQHWDSALAAHERSSGAVAEQLKTALGSFTQTFEERSAQLLDQVAQRSAQAQAEQSQAVRGVADSWTTALAAHERSSGAVAEQLKAALSTFTQTFEERSASLLAQVEQRAVLAQAEQLQAARGVADGWTTALAAHERSSGAVAEQLTASLTAFTQTFEERSAQLLAQVEQRAVLAQAEQLQAARGVADGWTTALAAHERSSGAVAEQLTASLTAFTQTFEERSAQLLAQVEQRAVQAQAEQLQAARGVAEGWTTALAAHERSSGAVAEQLKDTLAAFSQTFEARSASLLAQVAERLNQSHTQQTEGEQQRLAAWTGALQGLAAELQGQWQRAAEQLAGQQQGLVQALEQRTGEVAERVSAQAGRTLDDAAQLLQRSDELVRSRISTEAEWHQQHGQRMDQLAQTWRTELQALRDDESQRGQAAVERLGALEAAVAQHLSSLGASLEAPLSRLLQTAAEVPQAAASVIAQLREEMSLLTARDNQALQERTALVTQLGELLQSVNQATGEQRAAMETLVATASATLAQSGERFVQLLDSQAAQSADTGTQLATSAVELASLGDAFSQGVQLFQASSDQLLQGLDRIEASLARHSARSDEQLAYYVSQAREVIDLSIASQQGLIENLQRLGGKSPKALALAEGAEA